MNDKSTPRGETIAKRSKLLRLLFTIKLFVKQNYKIYTHKFYFISNPRQNCRDFQNCLDVSVKLVNSIKSVYFFGQKQIWIASEKV